MIVSSPACYLRRTILARPHTGFREKKWRRVAVIVTMCRPDCGGAFFRGGFSVGEPKEPRCVLVREAAGGCNSSRVVILGAAKERRGLPGIPRARSGTDLMTSSQEAPRRRRWTRWLGISALAGLIALAASVLALPRIVDFPWVQRQLLVQANRLLAPGGVRFDHLRVSWSRPTEIEGLVLRDPQGDDIVTAPRAHFSMNLWEILVTRPAAATLTLDAGRGGHRAFRRRQGRPARDPQADPQRPAQAYAPDPDRRRQAPVSPRGARPADRGRPGEDRPRPERLSTADRLEHEAGPREPGTRGKVRSSSRGR